MLSFCLVFWTIGQLDIFDDIMLDVFDNILDIFDDIFDIFKTININARLVFSVFVHAGTQAVLSFTLNQAGAAHLICLLVAGGDWSGSGTYAQPASLTVGVAEITSRSPSQIGTLLVVPWYS